MRIGILPNIHKEKALQAISEIVHVKGENTEIIISESARECLNEEYLFGDISTCDVVISLGGDGTLIQAAHQFAPSGIPVLGINLGNLGFLTEAGKNDLKDAVKRLETNNFIIEDRMMIEVCVLKDENVVEKYFALNDAVLARKALSRMVQVTVLVDELLVDTYHADGIIVSTPTGSTGYSLSAGGPIIEPTMKMMLVTPICSHSLNSRTVIISNEKVITLQPSIHKGNETALTIDGQINIDIEDNMKIKISQAGFSIKLVKFSSDSYFKTLRKKLFER